MSSWEEYKKKKKKDTKDILVSNSSDVKVNNSNINSWQKYKQEKEANSTQISSWQKFKQEKAENKKITIEEENENTWFKGSDLYKDNKGNVVTDTLGTIGATVGDIGLGLGKGIFNLVEGAVDLGIYGVADAVGVFGNETTANNIREKAKYSATDEIFEPLESTIDKNSVLGDKSDSIVEGLGYVAGITAISILSGGMGTAFGTSKATAATIGSTVTTFTSAMGNGMTEALNDGATIDEARIYGTISGAAEAGSELMFGGLGKASEAMGLSKGALDDVIVGGLTKNIKNKLTKTIVQSGLKAGGEGFEEVVSGFISAIGKKVTYMKEEDFIKILSNEKLGEQFFMGALTSAIAQVPSTYSSVKNGTDIITGRTDNEQKVYDSEVKTRTESKVRQATIEQAYNEQIKVQENLGIEMTEDLKKQIMQKVENAYDSGTLKTVELNKKDKNEIENQVENDLQEGNISAESIMKILGENQDISKDSLLMRSMYENEQKYNSYQIEKTDNEKVNILLQSAADAGMNNTRKTRRKIELISKLVQDTDRQYKFVSPENLKEMGYNENANGLINKSTGEILINAHSEKGLQSIVGHETTHIFDNKDSKGTYTKEYKTLQDMVIEYAKTKGIYDSKVKSIIDVYGDLLVDENQIKEELTADFVGDFLFNDEKFIENLSVKDKNIFQKIYDYIKHIYKVVTAGTEEAKAIENLKYQFDKVYKSVSEERNTDIKYSIAGKEGMKNAIKNDTGYLKIERNYNKAQQMHQAGIDNETIRERTGWFQDKNGDWKFEFSDKDMSLNEKNKLKKDSTYKLVNILKHDTLFTIYPQLKDLEIQFRNLNKVNGNYSKNNNIIRLNNKLIGNRTKIEGTIIHEIQHAIQNIEKFEGGKSSKRSKLAYYSSLGEIEANDTQNRFIQEKYRYNDLTNIAPESSKPNPKHQKMDNYIKNRKLLDKIKDSMYNYFKGKGEYNENFEYIEEDEKQSNQENRGLVLERTRSDIRSYGTLGNSRNENGRKITEKIQESKTKLQKENDKIKKATYENEEKNSKEIWGISDILDKNIQESENNSDSFSFDSKTKRYEDLILSDTINYNKDNNGKINIEIFNGNELINQFSVNSKEEAVKQLGANIGKYIYENVNEDSKILKLSNKTLETTKLQNNKEKQFDIIKNTNPMLDDYHVGIRKIEDIKTFEEIINDDESFAWGDFSKDDAEKALKKGKITIYSSYPIKQGTFVSTSKIQAEQYAGGIGQKIYQKTVSLDEIAWINGDEGQYANVNQKYSLTNDTKITGDDVAVKDLLKEEKPNIENEVGNNVLSDSNMDTKTNSTIEDIITQTEEQKQQGMKDKAKKYLSRSKTKFINKIVDDFGTSKIANTKTLNSVVDKIREDIIQNGKLTKEKTNQYFNELYDNMIKIDSLYYDTYKDLKDNLKSTKLYISDSIKNNITDFVDFKKSNIGSLLMTTDSNNIPVDTYYQELSELYPELFPQDIINPADQLNKLSEVSKDITKVETNVAAYNDKYLGKDYRNWARESFDKDINDFMQDIKLANRYNEDTNENIKIGVDKEIVKEAYRELPNARKKYEKAMSKELLTKEDRLQVDRLLNNEIGPQDIPLGYNKKGILKIAEAKLEYDSLQKAIKEYQQDIKTNRIEQARSDVGNLELWKDKKYGFQYSRETPIRNIYDIAPKDIADNIAEKYFRSYIEANEKKVVDAINGYNNRIKQLEIGTKNKYEIQYIETQIDENNVKSKQVTKKVSESALVQLLGEKKITTEDIVKSGADLNKIQYAVNEFRSIYNELIEQINESMLDNGYAPVEYRKDYFPHFTEEKTDTLLGKAAKLLGINVTNREELPTDIAGQTYQFKPGKTWFSNILQRVTDVTDYDVLKGFDKYIRGATDLIYHTGDIQNLRALSAAIRGTYNDVEMQNKIEEIKESTMSELDKANAIQEIYNAAKDKSHLSKFIEWLDNYTNLLAGKKTINDRGVEKELNRQIYKTMTDIESRIAANAIGGNIGVSLTNFSPLSQAWGEVKTTNLINGIWQTMKASLGKDSSFASESQFLTRRRGTEYLSETTLNKVTKPINNILQFADDFTSEVIVRARYNQNLQNGMNSEYALEEADRYTASLMADRGRGALPTQFNNKNPISKMINMFQVEVNNQWSYYFKDLPKNIQNKAHNNKTKVITETALAYTKIMVGAYLTNELLGSIRGNSTRVLPDPIYIIKELIKGLSDDDDENDDDTIIETMTEIAGNVPFIALPSTLLADSLGLDVGDIGRISISGAIPNVSDITSNIFDMINGEKSLGEGVESIGGELLDTVGASLILPYGGSQIKKSIKGISLYSNDIPGSYNDSGDLRYTVDEDIGSKIQATLFGAYANPYAQDYIDSGFKSIKKDNINEMVGLGMNSSEYRKLKEELNNVSTTTDKNGYKQYVDSGNNVYWYDSDTETMYDSNYKKTTLTEDDLVKVSKTEEALNYINSLDLTDLQKNIVANNLNKNSKKTIDMAKYGDYSSYEEYKYARDYPEKYSVVSQITDYKSYEKYKSDIEDIKKKYSSDLGYESKERKMAVQEYINNLDLNIYQKMMLEKMAGGYSIKNYQNYIYDYLESTNLTNSEKYTVWEELFD